MRCDTNYPNMQVCRTCYDDFGTKIRSTRSFSLSIFSTLELGLYMCTSFSSKFVYVWCLSFLSSFLFYLTHLRLNIRHIIKIPCVHSLNPDYGEYYYFTRGQNETLHHLTLTLGRNRNPLTFLNSRYRYMNSNTSLYRREPALLLHPNFAANHPIQDTFKLLVALVDLSG